MSKLYFAYGSNLNMRQMRWRCPKAQPVGKFKLNGVRLVFRGVADVADEPGASCWGGLWLITPECEVALDRYEGFRPDDPEHGMYRKVTFPLRKPWEGFTEGMFYQMNSTGIMPPSISYLRCIEEGYRDFKLPRAHLDAAVQASVDDKAPSHIERQRRRRTGRPALASELSRYRKAAE
jgi:hypothetical protein